MSQFQIVPRRVLQDIDNVCENIRSSTRLTSFECVKYVTLKVEKAFVDMKVNFKYTTIELGKELPKELYNKIDAKWKWALTAKKLREVILKQVMLDSWKHHMAIEVSFSIFGSFGISGFKMREEGFNFWEF